MYLNGMVEVSFPEQAIFGRIWHVLAPYSAILVVFGCGIHVRVFELL